MKTLKIVLVIPTLLSAILLLPSCRKDEGIQNSTDKQVIYPDPDVGEIKGFFLLNEGNMGSNKASLDYFDYETGIYSKNIYPERNPGVVRELGDVGNDIQIYGQRLYAVINCSNLVEVMDVSTARHIGVVSIPNCRYIVFQGKYAYISSYAGPVEINPNARLGYVAKVDTASLDVIAECVVGYQPEEMVIAGNKLYVANSGGYKIGDYDHTVSVVDLDTFKEVKKIDVGINLHRMELDRFGYIWVSSRGDYYENERSKTYVIDTRTDKVVETLHLLPNSNMARSGDSLFVYGTEWSYISNKWTFSYAVVNTETMKIVDRSFIKDGTENNITMPYGIAVHPHTKEIFVNDAKDFVTPGKIYCYSPNGILKWSTTTGDVPAHIVFTTSKLQPLNN